MPGGRRVLVTRPGDAAEKTANRLARLGHRPVALPLSRIVPLHCPVPVDAAFDAVAVTSSNAIRHADAALVRKLDRLPCLAVGDATAQAAARAGFGQVSSAGGDMDDLAAMASRRLPRGARVAYLCGRVRRPQLESAFHRAGFRTTPLETYDTEKVSYSTHELEQRLGLEPIDDIMVYSVSGAEAASHLLNLADLPQIFENTRILCISERVAKALAVPPGLSVGIADHPDEASLLALL